MRDYYPFGDERVIETQGSGSDDRFDFTNKERDDESGLMYFEARYLDTDSGRFMSRDPFALSFDSGILMRDPQQFNEYSYSRNNPIILSDSSGESILGMLALNFIAKKGASWAMNNPVAATQSGVSMVPYVGDAMDVYEVVSGKNAFTGEKLSTTERIVTGGAALLPIVGGSMVRNVGGEAIKAGSNIADDIIQETLRGSGDITSNFIPTVDELLDAGKKFVGDSYDELGGNGTGVFRGNNSQQFRLDESSLGGSHSPGSPHAHFEKFDDVGNRIVNNHVKFKE